MLERLSIKVYQMPVPLGSDWAVSVDGYIIDEFTTKIKAEDYGLIKSRMGG